MTVILHDIDCLDDIGMLERRAHAKLCRDLFLVLLFRLACTLRPKLLDGVDDPAALLGALDEADGAACAAAQDPPPLAVLFGEVSVGGIVE